MIPVIIIWLIRRYREKNKIKKIAVLLKNSKKHLKHLYTVLRKQKFPVWLSAIFFLFIFLALRFYPSKQEMPVK